MLSQPRRKKTRKKQQYRLLLQLLHLCRLQLLLQKLLVLQLQSKKQNNQKLLLLKLQCLLNQLKAKKTLLLRLLLFKNQLLTQLSLLLVLQFKLQSLHKLIYPRTSKRPKTIIIKNIIILSKNQNLSHKMTKNQIKNLWMELVKCLKEKVKMMI